jgi:hypothetical protein
MQNFRIFTESKADIKFITDYIEIQYEKTLTENDFYSLGSWSGYKTGGKLISAVNENIDNKRTPILILDADMNFEQRRKEVLEDFAQFNTNVELFLFPNNASEGNLESLLAVLAVDRKVMDCFLEYENCVSGHPKPLNHSRIYSYLDMMLYPQHTNPDGNDLRKEEYRDYTNEAHWNLQHEYLTPLKLFLDPFFLNFD